jgi:hypothetical protein
MRPTEDDVSASRPHAHRSRSGSQSREVGGRWLGRIGRDESATRFDLFDEWLSGTYHSTFRDSKLMSCLSQNILLLGV